MNNELTAHFSDAEFVLKTQIQISKDFAKFGYGFPIGFEEEAWEVIQIEMAIQSILVEMMRYGESKLLPLIYTVDLAEEKFLRMTQQVDFIEVLAKEIIKREALKVYIRSKYK